jgi:hypothetical protein
MTTKALCAFAAFTAVAGLCFAQDQDETVKHQNIYVGGGAAIPTGNTTNYLGTAPLFAIGYGYRFNRWFQADAGFQAVFGAANNQNLVQTAYGPVQGGDHEFMLPLGGRIYIPTPIKRISLSVGGGTAYLHYSETAPSNAYTGSSCYNCASRGGWGGYGLADARYFLDSGHVFSVGTTLQYIAAATNGQAVGNIPALKTTDHWINVIFGIGLSF